MSDLNGQTKQADLLEIHESMINGQRKQAVRFINDYIPADFFPDYRNYLDRVCEDINNKHLYYTDAVISYFRITDK